MFPVVNHRGVGLCCLGTEEAVWGPHLTHLEQSFTSVIATEEEPEDKGCPFGADRLTASSCPDRMGRHEVQAGSIEQVE